MSFQGIIPKNLDNLAQRIGEFAGREFLNFNIEEKINDPKHLESIKPLLEKHLDEFLRIKLVKEIPMVGMFVGDKTIDKLKNIFLQEIGILFPKVIGQFANNIKAGLDIQKEVEMKIIALSPARIQALINTAFPGVLRKFMVFGALTGFIIGVIILIITLI